MALQPRRPPFISNVPIIIIIIIIRRNACYQNTGFQRYSAQVTRIIALTNI
jgi:hypothetical protein